MTGDDNRDEIAVSESPAGAVPAEVQQGARRTNEEEKLSPKLKAESAEAPEAKKGSCRRNGTDEPIKEEDDDVDKDRRLDMYFPDPKANNVAALETVKLLAEFTSVHGVY